MSVLLTDHFRAMARNNAWCNDRLLKASAQLTPAEFIARRVSFFPSLCQTLNHILVVDRYYLADLMGTGRVIGKRGYPLWYAGYRALRPLGGALAALARPARSSWTPTSA